MNVPTISITADVAQVLYDRYRSALESCDPTPDDQTILIGYKALAAGKKILNIHDVFRTCPANQQGLPCFAIARADWQWCWLSWRTWRNDGMVFSGRRSPAGTEKQYYFSASTLAPHFQKRPKVMISDHRALVPLIPPSVRPKSLKDYTILWEAEWQAVAPTDPILLKKLSGSLYVILAAWDLTELERAVLAGRFIENER